MDTSEEGLPTTSITTFHWKRETDQVSEILWAFAWSSGHCRKDKSHW